jgi:GTPase SAR1 family protein
MGLCASQDGTPEEQQKKEADRQRSRDVDKAISSSQHSDQQINKLLLLGAGESGKSTLFKQMQKIYGKGFSEGERKNYTSIIFNNMVLSIKMLVQQAAHYGGVKNEDAKRVVLEVKEEHPVDLQLGPYMKIMWQDPGVKAAYEHRSRFQLNDSTEYFFSRIDEIMQPNYIPTEQDVLRSRVPTTGIVENSFEIDGNSFRMLDVGGQRSERKKWIHCFENVTAVLFVAAISAYDQVLYEDENTGRMVEALELFEEITNSEWFHKTSMILFLNKKDLFAEKIKKVPLKNYFPLYNGNSYEEATEFIQEMFEEKNRQEKDIYTHITCATDTNNIFTVFSYVKDIIIKKGLSRAGLM